MGLNAHKIIGYVLLCIGLIFIIFAVYSVYEVFTNATKPPEIFQTKDLKLSASSADKQPTEITITLDSDVRKIVNTFLYYIFMFFISAVGSKVSTLGIQLIREIKIGVRGEG